MAKIRLRGDSAEPHLGGSQRRLGAALAALLTGASLGTLVIAAPTPALAQAETAVEFDIPAQPVASALVAFARQARVRLVMTERPSGGARANAVRGALGREQALAQLLAGTGVAARLDNGAIHLQLADGSRRRASLERGDDLLQFAQADAAQTTATDAASAPDARSEAEAGEGEEIVVTGTNIRGVYPSSSPVEIYSAEDIARTGATTTEQFVQKLPQNLGTRTQFATGATLQPNFESVNSLDLRGLGVGTTLVLLNGRRLALASSGQAADVSMIPASAIDRVEVLTDGASAIYGSDAIGGVVNFVLRDDFEGAETRLSYGGVTSGGLRQGNLTQTFGRQWGSGQALLSLDYLSASALQRGDRSFVAPRLSPGTLTPADQRQSALATFSQDITGQLTASGDFAFSRREAKNFGEAPFDPDPLFSSRAVSNSQTDQYFANLGADYTINDSLNASFLASYSKVQVGTTVFSDLFNLDFASTGDLDTHDSALDLTATLGGSLFTLPAGKVRFSLGAGFADEQFGGVSALFSSGASELSRTTAYLFGEIFAPLVSEEQDVPFVNRLELSLAARRTSYDDTSNPPTTNFGARTSPKIGLLWAPTDSLSLRATYSEAFRAPSLTELDPLNRANSVTADQFLIEGVQAAGMSAFGAIPDIQPETAESFTFGFDYRPVSHPNLHINATYFSITYDGRIAIGDPSFGALSQANPSAFPDVVFHPPSASFIEGILRTTTNAFNDTEVDLTDPAAAAAIFFANPDFWIVDLRSRNLAASNVDGFDFAIGDQFDTQWGEISLGGQFTRILDYTQQVTRSAPLVTVVDTVLLPIDLRGRVYAGLSRGGFETTLSVNYADDYTNPFASGGSQAVSSWTTIDWNSVYDFGQESGGSLDGVRLSLSVQNLFDEDPPFVASDGGSGAAIQQAFGFDPANASPVGRFVVVGITKRW